MDRVQFIAQVLTGPMVPADAIVVLEGDGIVRLETAEGLLRERAAHFCIFSGGVDDPPHGIKASVAADFLISRGLHPSRVILDETSTNTHEQAEWLADYCAGRRFEEWGHGRFLLSVSAYHAPRAMLTYIASLMNRGLEDRICLLPIPCGNAPWQGKPAGQDLTRAELFMAELGKIDEYHERGHCASYEDGLAYLHYWEKELRRRG